VIKQGDDLLVVEAMKMQNLIKATMFWFSLVIKPEDKRKENKIKP
jgi:acetyl/propionyl-CoA carboxylase alpha subunit